MASNQAATVVARLLDDDYIHEQIGTAGAGLRDAYRRVRRLPPEKAVQDKTVYDHVRQAATGLTQASRRAFDKPEAKPPKRSRLPPLLVLLTTGGVVVWLTKKQSAPAQLVPEPVPVPVPAPPPDAGAVSATAPPPGSTS